MEKRQYLVWALTENQPNLVEKMMGLLRRQEVYYTVRKLYFEPLRSDGMALFTVEVECTEKSLRKLIKFYSQYVEVIDIGYKPVEG